MIRMFGRVKVFVSVISARRPNAVKLMTDLIGPATWFVDDTSMAEYAREFGVHSLSGAYVVADGLCEARNAAIECAFNRNDYAYCLQLSDDLKKIEEPVWSAEKQKHIARPLTFDAAIKRMINALQGTGAKLAGVAPTANPFYYNKKPIHPRAFIVGDMMLIAPPSPLRFDESMRLKEDYDHTLQHLEKYGRVARCDDVLATFQHKTNKGGAVSYRTLEEEQKAITYLKQKWGARIRDNPKREGEILLNLR